MISMKSVLLALSCLLMVFCSWAQDAPVKVDSTAVPDSTQVVFDTLGVDTSSTTEKKQFEIEKPNLDKATFQSLESHSEPFYGSDKKKTTVGTFEPTRIPIQTQKEKDRIRKREEEVEISIPKDLCGEILYIQRFAPINLKDLSNKELALIREKDSISGVSNFIEIQRFYNQLLYRKFNESLEEFVAEYNRDSGMQTIYVRDFEEIQADSIRFLLKPRFSIVDLLAKDAMKEERGSNDKTELSFFIYDKARDTAYCDHENLTFLSLKLQEFDKLCEDGTARELTDYTLELTLKKAVAPHHLYERYTNSFNSSRELTSSERAENLVKAVFTQVLGYAVIFGGIYIITNISLRRSS